MFSGRDIPSVGASIGIERLMTLMGDSLSLDDQQNSQGVFIASIGNYEVERMQLCKLLWQNGIKAETSYKYSVKPKKQFERADDLKVDITIVFGQDELDVGIYKVKNMKTGIQVDVQREDIVNYVLRMEKGYVKKEEHDIDMTPENDYKVGEIGNQIKDKAIDYTNMQLQDLETILTKTKYINSDKLSKDDYKVFKHILKNKQ